MSLSRELITQRRLAYQSCCVTLQYESSSCKYLSVSAWTQSVDRKAGPTFLSMSRILMSGLEFSSWRSSRSCFERLFLQCEFQPRSSFATLREAWRVCPQDLGFPWMESSRLERIIWGWNRCFEVGWQTYLEGELFGKSLEFAGWTEELLKGARKVWTSDERFLTAFEVC